jgi:hypothetical protein
MRLILDSASFNVPFAAIRLFLALLLFARFSERAFPSMLRNKVKSQEANVVCFCIETHDIRCLRITPCRAFVGWRLLSGKSRGSRLLIGETRGGNSIDCTSWLYGQTIEFVELNKSHSRLETRQLAALVVADSFPSRWYSQMGSVLHWSCCSLPFECCRSCSVRLPAKMENFFKTISFPRQCYSEMHPSCSSVFLLLSVGMHHHESMVGHHVVELSLSLKHVTFRFRIVHIALHLLGVRMSSCLTRWWLFQ